MSLLVLASGHSVARLGRGVRHAIRAASAAVARLGKSTQVIARLSTAAMARSARAIGSVRRAASMASARAVKSIAHAIRTASASAAKSIIARQFMHSIQSISRSVASRRTSQTRSVKRYAVALAVAASLLYRRRYTLRRIIALFGS